MKNKRGFTLVEISIVLAVIAIVSTMVVSFIILVSHHITRTTEQNDLELDLYYLNSVIPSWVSGMDREDVAFSVDGDSLIATKAAQEGDESISYKMSIVDGTFSAEQDVQGSYYYRLELVQSMTVEVIQHSGEVESPVLIVCTVTYKVPGKQATERETIVVSTRFASMAS